MTAMDKLARRVGQVNSLLCVGLDSDISKIPTRFQKRKYPQFEFNKWIIEETHEFVSAYKPNTAFYEARGEMGWHELKMTMEYLRENYPNIFTICDAKRADIGNTNEGYVSGIFDWLNFDAVTLNPYLGREALLPFLERKDKVSIILCRTSNPGASEFQDLLSNRRPLWQTVAEHVRDDWNANNNCMLVIGATYPGELAIIRKLIPGMSFLIPGIGAQGGELGAVLEAGLGQDKNGLLINSSRGIIFSAGPAVEAKKLQVEINNSRI